MRCDPELSVDLRTAQWLDWPAGTGGTADVRFPSKNDSSWPDLDLRAYDPHASLADCLDPQGRATCTATSASMPTANPSMIRRARPLTPPDAPDAATT